MKTKNSYLSPVLTLSQEFCFSDVLCASVDGLNIIDGTDVDDVTDQFDF